MPALSAADRKAINTLWERMGEALGNKDGTAIASLYADDADLIGIDGTEIKGRKEIGDYYNVELHRKYANVHMTDVKFEQPRRITKDVAIISGTWMVHGMKPEPVLVHSTMIVRRERRGWRYVTTRYMAALPK